MFSTIMVSKQSNLKVVYKTAGAAAAGVVPEALV